MLKVNELDTTKELRNIIKVSCASGSEMFSINYNFKKALADNEDFINGNIYTCTTDDLKKAVGNWRFNRKLKKMLVADGHHCCYVFIKKEAVTRQLDLLIKLEDLH
jgi:hypothetical protein